jgi:hypothetical protein
MTVKAPETPRRHLEVTPFNPYRLPVQNGICHLLPRRFQYATEGGAGNLHAFGTLFLLQSLKILQAYGLSLINGKTYLLKYPSGHPRRLEIGYLRYEANTAPIWQSAHSIFLTAFA